MEEKIKRFQEELEKLWVKNHIIDWWIKEKNWVLSVKIDKNLMNNNFIYIFYKNWTIKANVINIDKKEIIYDIDYEELKKVVLEVLKFKEFLFLIQKWFLVEKYMWISDLESFEILNKDYAKDKNFVYYSYGWGFKKIEWSDPESFEILNEKYAKDKNFVYYRWEQIEWLDSESFEIINEDYAKDKNFVYFYRYAWVFEKIEWLDSESFEILNKDYAKDKNSIYYCWEKILYLYFDENWFNYYYRENYNN